MEVKDEQESDESDEEEGTESDLVRFSYRLLSRNLNLVCRWGQSRSAEIISRLSASEHRVRSEEAEKEGESRQRLAPPLQETEKEDDQQRLIFLTHATFLENCSTFPYWSLFVSRTGDRSSASDFSSLRQTESPV